MTKTPFSLKRGMKKLLWLANLLFALVLSLGLWFSYQQHLRYADERAANTSLMLERALSGVFDQIDMLLISVQDELEDGLAAGKIDIKRVDALILRLARNVPGLNVVRYTDATGYSAAQTGFPAGNPANDYQDRDYFQYLRDHPDAGTINSKPLIGRSAGRWGIVFARSLRDPGGKFAGTVLISIDMARFSSMFEALKLSDRSRISFVDRNFSILATIPAPEDHSWFGRRLPNESLIKQLETGKSPLLMKHDSVAEGRPTSTAVRKLESRRYWIGVGIDIETETAPWRLQVGLAFIVMLIFTALTGAAGRQLQQGWRRQEASRAMLENTLEATGDGILVVGADGKVMHSNRNFASLWRLPDELVASNDDQHMIKMVQEQLCDPQEFLRQVEALYANPEAESFDTLNFKDGRCFERASRPVRIDGEVSGRVWSFHDVSDKKRIDDLLHFVAQRAWVASGQDFLPALAQRLGELLKLDYVIIDKLGESPGTAETVGLYAHGSVQPNLRYSLAGTPCENVIGKTICVYRQSIQQLFPEDGLLVEMKAESYIGIPLWDAAGKPVGLIAALDGQPLEDDDEVRTLFHLVAASAGAELERQREEQILRAERDRAQGYLDTVEAIILALDAEGTITLVNRKGCQILGQSEAELLGKSWFATCAPQPEGMEESLPFFRKMIAGEITTAEYMESVIVTKTGERRHIAWHDTLLRDKDGKITGTLSAGEDVTDRRRIEQELARHRNHLEELVEERTHALNAARQLAEAANRAKSVFLSNMSHELRTPLNAVIGFSQLMTRSPALGQAEKRNLEIINRSGNHLLALINDVLELSKIDAGSITLQEEPCDLATLAREVADMLRTRAEQAGLSLTLTVDVLSAAVRVDTTKLRQVLINLLGNAIKFTPAGSVGLTLKGSQAKDGALRVIFEVSDTGIGIAPADQHRIFEPFTQLVTHATSAGTGLGLSITRQYLQMMGGELAIESSLGRGSCFRFALTLPLAEATGAATPSAREVEATSGRRVLIVEDNADSRYLVVQLLTPLGLILAEAADGVEAVAQAAQFEPDLIIMDWRMPNLDGLEATRRIRAQTTGKPPKILMLSANAFEEQKREALAAGIDDFLRKPLQEEELYAALEAQLGCVLPSLAPAEPGTAVPDKISISTAELAALPSDLLVALSEGIEEMNPAKIKALLAQIEPDHPQLAQDIGAMTETFRYQALWQLLKDTRKEATITRTDGPGETS